MRYLRFTGPISHSYRCVLHRLKRNSRIRNQPSRQVSFQLPSISVTYVDEDGHSRPPSSLQSVNPTLAQGFQGELNDSTPRPKSQITFAEPFVSQKLSEMFGYGVNLGCFAGVHYYHWETEDKRMVIRNPRSSNVGWWLGIWFLIAYLTFAFVQLIVHISSYEGLDFDKLILWYTMALLLLPLVFQLVSTIHRDQVAGFANRALQFCNDYAQLFDADLRETESVELKMATIYLQWTYGGLGLLMFLVICAAIAMPDLSAFCSSLCPDPSSSYHIPMRIIGVVVLIPTGCVYLAWSTLYVAGLALIICMLPTISHLNILHAKRDLHGPRDLLHLYRQLYLIYEELNGFCSMLLFPSLENVLVTLTVFGLYGTLRTNGVIRLAMLAIACVAFTCLIILFWTLGKIHTASSQVLATWQRDLRFSRRELGPIRPVRIRLARYGYVDAGIIITIVDIIVNYSITLLITT